MCEGHSYCKTEREIRDWISGMYIVLLYNQVRFNSEEIWENAKVEESRILYIPVSSQTRQLIPFKLSVSNLYLQDSSSIELGDVTLHEEAGLFAINPLSIMPYEKKDNVWVSVTIERDLHLTELQRTTYNFFDFVSDIGGLSGFLFPFFAIVVNIWSFNSFDNTMVSKLFRIQTN